MPSAPSRLAQLRAVGTAFLRARPWIVAPALVAQSALLVASAAPRRQVTVALTGFTAMLLFFAWEAWRSRTQLVTARWLFGSLLVTLVGVSFGTAATGGLTSPMLPILFAPAVVGFAAFGRAREGWGLLGAFLVAILAFAMLPLGFPFAPLPMGTARAMSLVAVLASITLLWTGVSGLTDAYAHAGDTLLRAGEELFSVAEARTRAMEALGAQVAHEIKNPLTAIKGLADLLAEKADTPNDKRRLEVMSGEVARIEAILRDYLSFSRPLGELAREPVELGALLRPLVDLLSVRAERAGVSLTATGDPVDAALDPRRVKEAALNLVLNALDASEAGGEVTVAWAREGDRVVVTVDDRGEGMADDVRERVGEAFFTTRAEGTGLGVRLARRVAEAHDGALSFEARSPRGTRARLTLAAKGGPA
jgi:signal transduction histidine kinase